MAGLAMALGAAAIACGCAEELDPVPMPVARVRGVVRLGDRPAAGGWIEFLPVDGTIGRLRTARLRPDGTFVADGVAVGKNTIRVVDVPIESPAQLELFARMYWAVIARPGTSRSESGPGGWLFVPFASPIVREIEPDAPAPLEIDVVAAAVRFQEELSRRLSAVPSSTTGDGP